MKRSPETIDRSKVRTTSADRRKSRVRVQDEARPHVAGGSCAQFLDALPGFLGADDLRAAVDAWVAAVKGERTVLFAMGAHLVKVGLSPVVVDLMERGAIHGIAMNGAGCVHDLELARMGHTSEDVAASLDDGTFGMAKETATRLNDAIRRGADAGVGMGVAVGRDILDSGDTFADRSILAVAARLDIPVTVHVAIGADIHHMHPGADGAALGATSYRDFETFTGLVATLQGGLFANVGSAVILPEVFLKSLALARNLGHEVTRFTTLDLDFIRQYRPSVNVVERPTRQGGRGIALTGHHEIMVPLLAAGVIEALDAPADPKG
ncbi:MAG: hypothetical protein VX574_04735 [Myxococcota bacterium]|nr:hypothetical protein [Myxococcota bacterium]